MKKYIQSMMVFAAIVSFASCSTEDNTTLENESAAKLMTFTATQEGDEQSTRAAISTTNSKVINWEEDDQISIFDGTKNNPFTLKDGEGTKSATFRGEAATAAKYTAVYPYTEGASYNTSNGTVTGITLKPTQSATDNSFDKEAALMIAEGDNTTLTFKNVVGYVKVKPTFNCTRIDLKAFDNSAVLAGKGTISFSNGEPTLDLSRAPIKDYAITLKGAIKENNYYYIAVPPVTLKAGWTIKFTASDGTVYSRKGTKDITFTRNKVTNLGVFDISETNWYDPRGNIVTTTQEVDLGLTITIGTKEYKVIFARSNLTKDGLAPYEYDFGDYFAFAAKEPWCTEYDRNGTGDNVSVRPTKWENTNSHQTYYWSTVPYKNNSSSNSCSKYTSNGDVLDMSDDAANVILGGDWQLPTKEIWVNLYNTSNYNWQWTTKEGYNGCMVKSITDDTKTVFLPAAGYGYMDSFNDVGTYGDYWSGTACSNKNAYYLNFDAVRGVGPQRDTNRYSGLSVRPVRLVEVPQ